MVVWIGPDEQLDRHRPGWRWNQRIDLDAHGFNSADLPLRGVQDLTTQGDIEGATVGADIDAIGAIT